MRRTTGPRTARFALCAERRRQTGTIGVRTVRSAPHVVSRVRTFINGEAVSVVSAKRLVMTVTRGRAANAAIVDCCATMPTIGEKTVKSAQFAGLRA